MKPYQTFTLSMLLAAQTVLGQDSHYWTQQYGTRSMLLSGSVIGGVEDLGAVYYNPARLSVISNTAFLLSASVYEYTTIKISDAFGNARNASTSTLKGVPTLAAGAFTVKKLPRHSFAYAVMTRQNSDFSFSYKNEEYKDVLATLPGDEYFGAEIAIRGDLSEIWTGFSWAYRVDSTFSLGVTTNYVVNKQSKGIAIALQTLSSSNEVALYRFNRGYDYSQNGLLWKIGFAWQIKNWQLGATVTTPMVALTGKGSYRFEELYSNIPGIGPKPETYATSYQDDLSLKNRVPWSAGFGATRKLGKNKIHLSTEWYDGIPQYTMMEAVNHQSQSNPTDTVQFHLIGEAKSVWNAGVGMEFYFNKKISGFASFSTDFSSAVNDLNRFVDRQPDTHNSTWNTDFYHVGGGVVMNFNGADITLGVTHTGANMLMPRPVNFPDNPSQPIFGGSDTADVRWDRWRFVFSFSFPFLKDYQKKLENKLGL